MQFFYIVILCISFNLVSSWLLTDPISLLYNQISTPVINPTPQQFTEWLGIETELYRGSEGFQSVRRQFLSKSLEWGKELLGETRYTEIVSTIPNINTRTIYEKSESSEYPYFRFLPQYVTTVPIGSNIEISSPCFQNTQISATQSSQNAVTVAVTVNNASSLLCSDFYFFATLSGFKLQTYTISGSYDFNWDLSSLSSSAVYDVLNRGIRVFRFPDNGLETIAELVETLLLFEPELTQAVSEAAALRNLDFLAKYAGVKMEQRSGQQEIIIPESEISSGDFFGVIRLDGLDPMLAWGMGSSTGHTVIALWIDGELYICESTTKDSYWPTDGVQKTPYRTWLAQAKAAGYNVVWAPLTAEARAQYNATAALQFFESVEGLEYGYHNLLFGWIDSEEDNYPCMPPTFTAPYCLVWTHFEIIMGLLGSFWPYGADLLVTQAMNKHVGVEGMNIVQLFEYAGQKGIELKSIAPVVEQDSWIYNTTRNGIPTTGLSQVCCVFVCNMWKHGGLFNSIQNEVNCAELTNFDDYALTILNAPNPLPVECSSNDPNNFLCQIEGVYTLELESFRSRTPYPHMAQSCSAQAPNYNRPAGC